MSATATRFDVRELNKLFQLPLQKKPRLWFKNIGQPCSESVWVVVHDGGLGVRPRGMIHARALDRLCSRAVPSIGTGLCVLVRWNSSKVETVVGPFLAGDLNSDDEINIFDLTYIATHYSSNDPVADINASGQVDIFDLVLVAKNLPARFPGWRRYLQQIGRRSQ